MSLGDPSGGYLRPAPREGLASYSTVIRICSPQIWCAGAGIVAGNVTLQSRNHMT
jgi:hypothetical protein